MDTPDVTDVKQAPTTPISIVRGEGQPVSVIEQYSSERSPNISEIKEFGAEVIGEQRPQIHPDIANTLIHSGENAIIPSPTPTSDSQDIKSLEKESKGSINEASTWFAALKLAALRLTGFRKTVSQGGTT